MAAMTIMNSMNKLFLVLDDVWMRVCNGLLLYFWTYVVSKLHIICVRSGGKLPNL